MKIWRRPALAVGAASRAFLLVWREGRQFDFWRRPALDAAAAARRAAISIWREVRQTKLWGRPAIRVAVVSGALLLIVEISLRVFGVLNFPLWRADPVLGYIPAPNQHGKLFNSADWVFNEHSMGVAAPFKATSDCTILIGDSLVFSDSKNGQPNKLGPLLQGRLHAPVWPIAANSWALQNELTYLLTRPEVQACPTIVIVSNSGDYQEPSVWKSELTHPRSRPLLGSLYVARKLLFTPPVEPFAWPTPAQEAQWGGSLDRFLAAYHGRLLFVLYPTKEELEKHIDRFGPFRAYLRGRAETFDLGPYWSADAYQDIIHPKWGWDPRFADLIAMALARPRPSGDPQTQQKPHRLVRRSPWRHKTT